LAIEFTQYLDSLPWGARCPYQPALVSTGPKIKIAVVALDKLHSRRKYAEKCDSVGGRNGFIDFRKFGAYACGDMSVAHPSLAPG